MRSQSGHFRVAADDGAVYHCRARGRLKRGRQESRTVAVAGDRVRFRTEPAADSSLPAGVIEEILPRRNKISRFSSRRGGGRIEQVMMANLDQLVAVQSISRPAPAQGFVDRLLAAAERFEVSGVLCLNKCDLDPEAAADERWDYYRGLGYGVLRTSAETGRGVDDLRETLRGRVSLLLGASGVGKSSLLQLVQPGLSLRTGEVTDKTGLGRHVTTRTELFALDGGGFIADSPGIRGFDPWDVPPVDLRLCFPDLIEPGSRCRFSTCLHRDEPDCGVKAAVAAGEIPGWRHRAYLDLLRDLESRDSGRGGRQDTSRR